MRRVFYEGVKLRSEGPVNVNSADNNTILSQDTIDRGPVIEVNIVSPTQILVSQPGSGNNINTGGNIEY